MHRITNDYSNIPERYRSDVKEIVEACARQNLIVSPQEAYFAWNEYSDTYAAGWLGLPTPYDDGESPWICTLDDCDKEITAKIEHYGQNP